MKTKDQPAYPATADQIFQSRAGLSKREIFAYAAIRGLSSCPIPGSHNAPKEIARAAVEIADELIKQLDS